MSKNFVVEIRIRDECDSRLWKVGILDFEPEKCKPDVVLPVREARPVIVPKWFSELQNQVIERG